MAKGFFRELKHYKLNEISIELGIEMEETKRLVKHQDCESKHNGCNVFFLAVPCQHHHKDSDQC